MSRVEDDREAGRVTARLAEQKRADEAQKTKKANENHAFSKLVVKAKAETQQAHEQSAAKGAIAQLLEEAEAGKAELEHLGERLGEGEQQQSAFRSKLGQKATGERVKQSNRNEGEAVSQGRVSDEQSNAALGQSRSADGSSAARSSEGRRGDSRVSGEAIDERKEASDAASLGRAGKSGKGELKTDADKGGGQGGGSGGKDHKEGAASPNFRFNPALMAPVPVAKAKETSGSERLRKVANELAQKIVERVRVGTNALGRMEFQVDLRNDVLSGLTVKVSAHNGKIKAVFSGRDRDVLKMIEEQGEALKSALGARGLTLEEFKTEART
jgi:hypothetical protein